MLSFRRVVIPTFKQQYIENGIHKRFISKRIFDKLSNGMQVDRISICGSQVSDVQSL